MFCTKSIWFFFLVWNRNLAPFSVLYLFGAKQTYYFKLRWCKGMSSYQEEEEGLDIPMVEMGEDLTDFDEIFMVK